MTYNELAAKIEKRRFDMMKHREPLYGAACYLEAAESNVIGEIRNEMPGVSVDDLCVGFWPEIFKRNNKEVRAEVMDEIVCMGGSGYLGWLDDDGNIVRDKRTEEHYMKYAEMVKRNGILSAMKTSSYWSDYDEKLWADCV